MQLAWCKGRDRPIVTVTNDTSERLAAFTTIVRAPIWAPIWISIFDASALGEHPLRDPGKPSYLNFGSAPDTHEFGHWSRLALESKDLTLYDFAAAHKEWSQELFRHNFAAATEY